VSIGRPATAEDWRAISRAWAAKQGLPTELTADQVAVLVRVLGPSLRAIALERRAAARGGRRKAGTAA
jgi:hypothetical protein